MLRYIYLRRNIIKLIIIVFNGYNIIDAVIKESKTALIFSILSLLFLVMCIHIISKIQQLDEEDANEKQTY